MVDPTAADTFHRRIEKRDSLELGGPSEESGGLFAAWDETESK